VNGKEVFTATAGVRIITTGEGKLVEAIGIEPGARDITIKSSAGEQTLTIRPNQGFRFDETKPVRFQAAPFSPAPDQR
jgi:hypothetical protein